MLKKNTLIMIVILIVLGDFLVAYALGNKITSGPAFYDWFLLTTIPLSVIITILTLNYYFRYQLSLLKKGLYSLKENMVADIPIMDDEFGEIANLANEFAINSLNTKTMNEHLVESLPLAVLAVDCEGKIIISSESTKKVLNCNSLQSGKYCESLLNPRSPLYLLQRTLRYDKTLKDYNYTVFSPDGHRHLSVCTDLIKDYNQKKLGALLTAWDITERVHMEEQLLQVEKFSLIGQLAAGAAHEIRNPLTSIKGLVQILAACFSGNEEARRHISVILEEVDRINSIIKELLLMAKPSAPVLSFIDLSLILNEVLLLLEGEAERKKVKIVKQYSKIPLAIVDVDQIKYVFLNIANNALTAMLSGGTLTIATYYQPLEEVIKVSFTDTGIGISPENLKRIFDPFFTTREDGTGLGLTVSYQIIRNHGGKLLVESLVNQGSVFTVVLPVVNYQPN